MRRASDVRCSGVELLVAKCVDRTLAEHGCNADVSPSVEHMHCETGHESKGVSALVSRPVSTGDSSDVLAHKRCDNVPFVGFDNFRGVGRNDLVDVLAGGCGGHIRLSLSAHTQGGGGVGYSYGGKS